jgi:hypothetical protein
MIVNGQNTSGTQYSSPVGMISKGKHTDAVWAMQLYEQLGISRNIHIRRLHYQALLQDGLLLPSGKTYCNTVSDFEFLKRAFEQARLLGLIPYDIFSDGSANRHSFGYGFPSTNDQRRTLLKQMIEQACRRHMKNMLTRLAPVHVEIWLERSTSADIVAEMANKYNLNIVSSETDITLTNIWHFIRRIGSISKPVRILYIRDFHPKSLQGSAIDKVKSAMNQYGLSSSTDLKFIKLALSQQECKRYNLPLAPESFTGRAITTELHALEAAAPGFLNKTLKTNIDRYFDIHAMGDAATKTDKSIERLILKINRTIDENPDIYKAFAGLQSMVSGN